MRPKTSTAANDGAAERKKIPRKDKIRRLAEREAERERGGRLECVIVQKLSLKHGPRSSGPVSRQLIAGVAKKYLKERPHLAGSTDIRRVGPIVDQVSAEVVKVAALRQAAGEPKMEEVTNKKPPQKESRDHLSTPELSKIPTLKAGRRSIHGLQLRHIKCFRLKGQRAPRKKPPSNGVR